jgi:hypothetical protein
VTASLPYNQREAGAPVRLQDTPRVNPLAVPNVCAPPALRDLRDAGGSHGSRDAGAGVCIRATLTSHGDGTEPPMRAARVPALFAMTLKSLRNRILNKQGNFRPLPVPAP